MNSHKPLIVAAAVVLGIVFLIYMANTVVTSKAFPSLPTYVASSTAQFIASSSLPLSTENIEATSTTSSPDAISSAPTLPSDVSPVENDSDPLPATLIHTSRGDIFAEMAETDAQMSKGLGDRASLPSNQGMLFVFAEPGVYAFWMKDMHFALDMVWIDASKKVVSINRDISPNTYPTTFQPSTRISYVLELNAGGAKKYGITVGTVLSF